MAHKQPDLFRKMCGRHSARQDSLFETTGHGRESALACMVCGAALVETNSGYLCCPNGHGKLLATLIDAEPCGSLFEPDLPDSFDGGA